MERDKGVRAERALGAPHSFSHFSFMAELNYEGKKSDSHFSHFGDLREFSQFSSKLIRFRGTRHDVRFKV